jgi:hypothetical protein
MSTAMGDRVPVRQRFGRWHRQILTTAPAPDAPIGMLLHGDTRSERSALSRACLQLSVAGLVRTTREIERWNLPEGVEPGAMRVRVWLTPAGVTARASMRPRGAS